MNSMQQQGEVRNLTGMRAFAAFWVVFYHWQYLDPLDNLVFLRENPFLGRGYWAVDLFFVLSGFIIAFVYHEKFAAMPTLRTYKDYIILRWARLYPIHVVLIFGYVLLLAAANMAGKPIHGGDNFTWSQLAAHLTLTQAWQIVDGLGWNWPSWSISAEFFAYTFLFPLYAWIFRRSTFPVVCALLLVTWCAAYAYGQISGHGFKSFHSGLLRITAEFLAGYLLFFFTRRYLLNGRQANCLFLVSVAGLAMLCLLPFSMEILLLPLLAGVVLSLFYGSSVLDKVFGNRSAVYLGHISYSLYMVHDLINVITGQAVKLAGFPVPLAHDQALLLLAALVVGTTIVAALGFHLVENPFRSWMKKRLKKSAAPKPVAVRTAPA
jgi:peptidoglycan/LPS O-acetylase OafA/YrhL